MIFELFIPTETCPQPTDDGSDDECVRWVSTADPARLYRLLNECKYDGPIKEVDIRITGCGVIDYKMPPQQ